MYFRLKDSFALRGWKLLPHGLTNIRTGHVSFLDSATFQAASFCDGKTSFYSPLILPAHRQALEKLLQAGVAVECSEGEGLRGYQKHRKSSGRFAASVHWSITGKCNLRCRHCYMSAPQGKYGEMTTDECLRIIDQIGDANIGTVSLTGGEPLVRKDWWQLVDALTEKHIVISQIYTNGLLVTDDLLMQMKERGLQCEFSLSFDGCGCHDWMRGMEGAELAAVEAIRRARSHGFPVSIETTLYRGNLDRLTQTYELFKELGVGRWKTSPAMSTGNWAREAGRHDIAVDRLYAAYLDLIQKHNHDKAPLSLMLGGFYFREQGSDSYTIPAAKYDGTDKALRQTTCRSCRIHPYIMPDGKLLPCIPMTGTSIEARMPSLLTTTIAEALCESDYFDIINTRLDDLFRVNDECSECEHRLRCGMGCRAAALQCSGSLHGRDIYSCHIFKHGYEERIKEAASTSINQRSSNER